MTRYKIRLKKESLKKSQIEKHKDFQSLSHLVANQKKSTSNRKLWMLIFTTLLILVMIFLGFMRIQQKTKKEDSQNVDELIFEEFKNE